MARYPKVTSQGVGGNLLDLVDLALAGQTGARVQPFAITNYDGILIEDVLLPIVKGSLRGGMMLDVEARKAKGTDYRRYVSQGVDTVPVGFTLNLFIDYSKDPPKDWRDEYERVEDRLMPRGLDARNAVRVSHPSYAGSGIQQFVPTKRGILQPVDVDRWVVDVEGYDVRFVQSGPRGATKQVKQDDLRSTGLVPKSVVGPAQGVRTKSATRSPTWR